jgi:hypothetical protein
VIAGGITRDTLWDSLKLGGTMSEDIMVKGWSLQKFLGVNWRITINKKGLVPTHQHHVPVRQVLSYSTMYMTLYMAGGERTFGLGFADRS